MSDGAVLAVSSVAKKYCRDLRRSLLYGVRDIGRELVPRARTSAALRPGEFWALEDVSFTLHPGEALAVVGHNGAGKSTLLRLLCGLVKPDRGQIRVAGRAGALLELGTGFDPLRTGRENVQVGAALHGITGRRMRRLLDDVARFAELEGFFDAPVQSYSTGMQSRLAYALIAHLEPDVLLIDEALAVGDISFQRKCVNHMRSFLADGGALLLVSHNVHLIQAVCGRGIMLDHGRVSLSGTAVQAVAQLFESRLEPRWSLPDDEARTGGAVTIEDVAIGTGGAPVDSGSAVRVTLRYRAAERVEATWAFSIWTSDQWVCVTGEIAPGAQILAPGTGELHCTIPRLPLMGGRYGLRAGILDRATHHPLAMWGYHGPPSSFVVTPATTAGANLAMVVGQLVTLDVDWPQPAPASPIGAHARPSGADDG